MNLRAESVRAVEEWLEAIPSKNTRKNYRHGVKQFEAWYGSSVTKLINGPEATRIVEKFFVHLKQSHPQNTCRNWTNNVIQFLKFNRVDVRPRRALGIYKTEKSTKHHRLTIDEVQRMASVGSLNEQVILETLLLGWRIGDVVRLKKADFDVLERDAPIPIRIRASKEGTLYESFISQEFKDLLKLYLSTVKGKWLFPGSDPGTHTKDKTLNRILQKLAKRAGIKLHGSLTWHCGRRLVYSVGASLGINSEIRKRLIGKSIPDADDTYLEVELKEPFLKLHSVLRLKAPKTTNRVGDVEKTVEMLKETLTTLEKENMVLKTRIDNLQNNTMILEDRLKEIGDFAAHTVEFGSYTEAEKEAIRKRFNLKEVSEEEKQLVQDFQEIALELQKEKGYLDKKDEEELKRRFETGYRKREKTKQRTKKKGDRKS